MKFALLHSFALLLFVLSGLPASAQTESDLNPSAVSFDKLVVIEAGRTVQDAVSIGGSVQVSQDATVTGSAVAIGGDVILEQGANVIGDAVAIGGNVYSQPGAVIGGSQVSMFGPAAGLLRRFGIAGGAYALIVLTQIMVLISLYVFGSALLFMAPQLVHDVTRSLAEHGVRSLIWGLGVMISVLIVNAMLAGSFFGAIAIPILGIVSFVLTVVGGVASLIALGRRMNVAVKQSNFRVFTYMVLVILPLSLLPPVGHVVLMCVGIFGIGATALTLWERYRTRMPPETHHLPNIPS